MRIVPIAFGGRGRSTLFYFGSVGVVRGAQVFLHPALVTNLNGGVLIAVVVLHGRGTAEKLQIVKHFLQTIGLLLLCFLCLIHQRIKFRFGNVLRIIFKSRNDSRNCRHFGDRIFGDIAGIVGESRNDSGNCRNVGGVFDFGIVVIRFVVFLGPGRNRRISFGFQVVGVILECRYFGRNRWNGGRIFDFCIVVIRF